MKYYLVILLLLIATVVKSQNLDARAGDDAVVMSEVLPAFYTLDASGSTGDFPIVEYYWVLDPDTVGTGESLTVALMETQTRFKLIVVDDQGNSDTDFIDLFTGDPTNSGLNLLPLRGGSQMKFVSGMNIAWNRFSNDLDEITADDRIYFEEVMDSISMNGGNALRWWLHTNGATSPIVNSEGYVEGIDFQNIQAMKEILDMAYDHGIVISMCLWSFDMLQRQSQDWDAMKLLLESDDNIQSYIDNALIPILEKIGDHPAVMTWEIFNEPEGMTSNFGWTNGGRISMATVQNFVNKVAGAIHRNTTEGLVSNGSWNIMVSTDVENFKNYYSRDELIAAGGDNDGYLDFYQVHYYPQHFDNSRSPFHRPASFWELDAPIVIGEFPADTIGGQAKPGFSTEKAYELAVEYGYAGIMSWSWSDTNFNKDFNTTARGLQAVEELIPIELDIPSDLVVDRIPEVVSEVIPFRSLIEDLDTDFIHVDLKDHFVDDMDGANLNYSISLVSDNSVVQVSLQDSEVQLTFTDPKVGSSLVNYIGADANNWFAESKSIVMIGSEELKGGNDAYYKPVYSSSQLQGNFDLYVNDGDFDTHWESLRNNYDTLIIDLGEELIQNFVSLHWRSLSTTDFSFQISTDGSEWTSLFTQEGSEKTVIYGAEEEFSVRYYRLLMENTLSSAPFEIREIVSENILNNQPPSVIAEVEDYLADLESVKNINNYLRFEDVFTDEEHPEYLEYSFTNSNPDLLSPEISLAGVGLSLIFEEGEIGESLITVTATDPFGESVSTIFRVEVTATVTGIDDELLTQSIYPNPATSYVNLDFRSFSEAPQKIQLFDMKGRKLIDQENSGLEARLDISNIKTGIYIVRVIDSEGKRVSRLIIE